MNKDEQSKKQQAAINQIAWILNYQPKIEHQHIYNGSKPTEDKEKTEAKEDKRKVLIATNTVIRTQTHSGQQTIDLLKLYRFIDRYFVSEIQHKYEWYALRRFLEKYQFLRDCDNVQFASQMNSKEWYAHSKKSCEANEMNYYNYLKSVEPAQWIETDIQLGSKATKKSLTKIYNTFNNLELYKEQIIGR